jgi:parallel beta helix pectate lyase-like protein
MLNKPFRIVMALALLARSALALTLHVAPDGNDAWSGKLDAPNVDKTDGPLASLAGARNAARNARDAGERGELRVVIANGTYAFTQPVVFEPQDSGVSYEAAAGAKPVFVGGKKISGWKIGADGVWTVQLDPAWRFEALWVNGQRARRARMPSDGYINALGLPSAPLPGVPLAGELAKTMIEIAPADAAILRGLSAGELRDVNVVVYHSWNETRHRLAGVNVEDGVLQFTGGQRAFFTLAPYHRLHFENLRAALDAPGEWFLARDGTLFYKPRVGEKPDTADTWAPVAMQWMIFKGEPAAESGRGLGAVERGRGLSAPTAGGKTAVGGKPPQPSAASPPAVGALRPLPLSPEDALVKNLRFRGLSFRFQNYELPAEGVGYNQAEHGLGAAIEADGARDVTFERCEFEHTMTNALWLRRGCRDITLRECFLHDLGGGGVKIGEPQNPNERDQTSHVTIDNCIIQTGGRYFTSAIGVLIFHASDCAITHCDIADFFYSAVSIGWVWGYKPTPCARNRVEFCHLHHLGWGVLSDMGAVYTLGPQPGSAIRNCHIHDIACASYGGWGMYNDEGSTGIVWENNLVHHTQDAGYHQHYGRDNIVRNNIIAFCEEEHLRRSRPENFHAFTLERNIVLMGEGKLFAQADKNWLDGNVTLDRNVYWQPGGTPIIFAGKTFADWQAATGNDKNSMVADPLFVAPEKGDWHLRPESPALKLGFVPFDWTQAGVTGDAAWRRLAAREFAPMIYGTKPKAPPLSLRDGFEGTPLGAQPAQAHVTKEKRKLITVVADRPSKGAHCLQLTDGPDVAPAFEPHFYYSPNHERGTTRVAFDVRMEPAYRLSHEWRDSSQPYRTGPMLTFEKGAISAPGRKLADLPPNEWVHVEIAARLGAESDGTFSVTLTLPGKEPQRFDGLKFVKEMRELKWLGFSSPAKEAAKCWLDEIEIVNDPRR